MRLPITAICLLVIAAVFSGCGKTDEKTTTTVTVQSESQSSASGSSGVGVAIDAGINQLYAENHISLAALRYRAVDDESICDAATGDAALAGAGLQPPRPAAGATLITKDLYKNPSFVSGSVSWESDNTGLPASGLNDSWWHVAMTFGGSAPFTVVNEGGDTAQISSGTVHLYIHDQITANDNNGNWVRSIDTYAVIPTATPVIATVAPVGGQIRNVTVTGQRHAYRQILRSLSGSTVTSTRIHRVDGDFSGYPAGAGVTNPGSGPALNDATGTAHPFTDWRQVSTISDTAHDYRWNRYATFALRHTYLTSADAKTVAWSGSLMPQPASVTVAGITVTTPAPIDNVYITLDGAYYGPLNWTQLRSFGVIPDYNGAGRDF